MALTVLFKAEFALTVLCVPNSLDGGSVSRAAPPPPLSHTHTQHTHTHTHTHTLGERERQTDRQKASERETGPGSCARPSARTL